MTNFYQIQISIAFFELLIYNCKPAYFNAAQPPLGSPAAAPPVEDRFVLLDDRVAPPANDCLTSPADDRLTPPADDRLTTPADDARKRLVMAFSSCNQKG